MQPFRVLLAFLHFCIDRFACLWERAIGASWRSWSYPVQMGVLYTFLWGFGLVTRPLFGEHLLKGAFSFLSPSDKIMVGGMLLTLTAAAFWRPRRYALASTYLIAALKIVDAVVTVNLFSLIFWACVIHGVRKEIDAGDPLPALVLSPALQRGISLGLLALTIFAWLRPNGGTLALIVAVCLIQAITALPRRPTRAALPMR